MGAHEARALEVGSRFVKEVRFRRSSSATHSPTGKLSDGGLTRGFPQRAMAGNRPTPLPCGRCSLTALLHRVSGSC